MTTSPSLKSSLASQGKSGGIEVKDNKLINIISANLFKHTPEPKLQVNLYSPSTGLKGSDSLTLRTKYSHAKKKYIESENTRQRLESELKALMETPCKNCELLETEHENTKQALDEAVQLSNMLLKEVHRLTL